MWNPLEARNLPLLMRVTGGLTMLAALQFLAPEAMLGASHMAVGDETGLFFARHWGLLVGCLAGLMIYAADQPALQRPVLFAVTVEKIGLVAMVALNANHPAMAGMLPAAVFDGICVLLFGAILLRRPR